MNVDRLPVATAKMDSVYIRVHLWPFFAVCIGAFVVQTVPTFGPTPPSGNFPLPLAIRRCLDTILEVQT
jgi:hypothetical protein